MRLREKMRKSLGKRERRWNRQAQLYYYEEHTIHTSTIQNYTSMYCNIHIDKIYICIDVLLPNRYTCSWHNASKVKMKHKYETVEEIINTEMEKRDNIPLYLSEKNEQDEESLELLKFLPKKLNDLKHHFVTCCSFIKREIWRLSISSFETVSRTVNLS